MRAARCRRAVLVGLYLGLTGLLLLFNHQYWLAPDRGRHEMHELQAQLAFQRHENHRLRGRNDRLAEAIDLIKREPEALEERARYELGLIRSGETFVRLLETR
ncbi:MAG: septum formation initiator family protein [Candidatus Competibacterales bacterium]|nr:septum formation initiator family protein [Candidatus Competibacterales bacterium]